ncbi:MAG TPA: glycoside hydrolase family 38 C-terminal domain-containing protein, partial [Candidatus Nitrosotenuis sp.]|nr:glycoside hydrolase family 38 C-terminal domain-containing protein [Candidatus Nitrosotenuis sp.]
LFTALDDIALRIHAPGIGIPVVVFNPLAWTRTDLVEIEVRFPAELRHVEVFRDDGKAMHSEVTSFDPQTNIWRVRFLADSVPPLGYRVYRVIPAQPVKGPALPASATQIENEFLRVTVDAKTGCMTSLFDKRANREALAPGGCGNRLVAFRDKPKDWDAWNIDANFEDEQWDLQLAEEVKLVEHSWLRAVIRVVKTFGKSRFTQDITLTAGIPRVDIRTVADWHEERILIKAAFPVNAKSDFATFEIPYGAIQRPTTRNTPVEKAKFEVPALRWADLSDASGGLSVLNDSKYGYDAKGNVLRISLLRSPKWPDPNADMGRHEFTYSLFPHAGNWKDASTVRRGYELNYPLLAVATTSHIGSLPTSKSYFEIADENVVLTALKQTEDGASWLVRFYEFAGRETPVRLRLPDGAARAWETNLMEQDERALSVNNQSVIVATKPYEIKSVRIEFAAKP